MTHPPEHDPLRRPDIGRAQVPRPGEPVPRAVEPVPHKEPDKEPDKEPAILGLPTAGAAWFHPHDPQVYLAAGTPTAKVLRIPEVEAQRMLRAAAREVAGADGQKPTEVVWVAGLSELLIQLNGVSLACAPGLVTITVPVTCDQAPRATVQVPFAVGTEEAPAGLVMSTLSRPLGPAVVVDAWAGPLTAFAWEALVHLAQALSGATGVDAAGQPLVPALVGAGQDLLLVQPMARHRSLKLR